MADQLKGSYLFVLKLDQDKTITVGKLGGLFFTQGYYLYAGSGMTNLIKRVKRHICRGKKLFWHLDYLREECRYIQTFLTVSEIKWECELAGKLKDRGFPSISGFGSSDCSCSSHLFYSPALPENLEALVPGLVSGDVSVLGQPEEGGHSLAGYEKRVHFGMGNPRGSKSGKYS